MRILFFSISFFTISFLVASAVPSQAQMPLPRPAQLPVQLLDRKILKSDHRYVWSEFRITSKLTGSFRLWHRGPAQPSKNSAPLPTILLLAGLESSQTSLDLLGDLPNAHVFSLDYEIEPGTPLEKVAAKVARRGLQMQAEILVALVWFSMNADQYDMDRFSSVNVSFGTFLAPAVLRVAQRLEIYPRATVFAFGGADIANFILPFLTELEPEDVRHRAEEIVRAILRPLDPVSHLKHLQGPFLVLRANADEVIPAESSDALEEALPGDDKIVRRIDAPHIDIDQPEVISELRKTTLEFLKTNGAL